MSAATDTPRDLARQGTEAGAPAGVPTAIDAQADLAAQPPGRERLWFDSIFIVGQVQADGHDFGYLVHVIDVPEQDIRRQIITITDATTGWFQVHNVFVPAEAFSWDSHVLDLRTPDLTWTGDARSQHLSATTPWGALDLVVRAAGPVLYYGGTGSFGLLGAPQHQYALPELHTTGTLTAQGRTWQVAGQSWLDRQWGGMPDLQANRWSWMNLSLPNGDKVAVWDIRSADGTGPEQCWATVMHPDATHLLVPVTPLAQDARRMHKSPTSDFAFPTEWTVTIPALDASLEVRTTLVDQEVPGLGASVYEGAATFSGRYRGEQVTGRTYVEQLGNWSA